MVFLPCCNSVNLGTSTTDLGSIMRRSGLDDTTGFHVLSKLDFSACQGSRGRDRSFVKGQSCQRHAFLMSWTLTVAAAKRFPACIHSQTVPPARRVPMGRTSYKNIDRFQRLNPCKAVPIQVVDYEGGSHRLLLIGVQGSNAPVKQGNKSVAGRRRCCRDLALRFLTLSSG
jgi:hypothetical protein